MASKFFWWLSRDLRIDLFKAHRVPYNVLKDLKYTYMHEWAKVHDNHATIGITDNMQDYLGKIVFVDLPEVGTIVTQRNSFGAVESVRATHDVQSPVSGKVIEVNEELDDFPRLVNKSPYDEGWLIKVEMSNAAELEKLMDSDEYSKYCGEDAKH